MDSDKKDDFYNDNFGKTKNGDLGEIMEVSETSSELDKGGGRGKCCKKFLKDNLLLIMLLTGLILGVVMGVALRFLDPPLDDRQTMYFRFPGEILMRMLKLLILPLIFTSLVAGLAGLDVRASGRIGLRAIVYYLSTTFSAVVLGIILVMTIRPGSRTQLQDKASSVENGNVADSFLDLIRNMFPDNILEAAFRTTKTRLIPYTVNVNATNDTYDPPMFYIEEKTEFDFNVQKIEGMNVLGLVVFAVALGIIISYLGDIGRPLYHVFFAFAEASMLLITLVIWYSPFGIMFLVASEIIKMKNPIMELQSLGLYMATVLTGLAIHGFIILPILYLIFVRRNPYKFIWGMAQALVTAFGTASSSATLPVTYRCLEEINKVDQRVTRFMLPVGATINMDGTALYEAVGAIFIAQLRGYDLNAGQVVAASVTSTLASIGAASVPQAGIVTMVIVLSALGLPPDDVTKILAVDWFLDRFRTAINVEGDAIGAGIVERLSRRDLKLEDSPQTAVKVNGDIEKGDFTKF